VPNWHEILYEIQKAGGAHDLIRRKYLAQLNEKTKRNVIIYYSGWLQKPNQRGTELNDADKNGLMTVINRLDRSKGLDLLLHTPGGETAATESFVDYLRSMFGTDIRAMVPQIALSAGTMIACACKEIIMGKQSSLGPIDPIYLGVPAHGVVKEFKRAYEEINADPAKVYVWQPILAKYKPTLIGECERAIEWANEMVKEWLLTGMLKGRSKAEQIADKIIKELTEQALIKSHARHLSSEKCKSIGLKINNLEKDNELQDAVLSVHHSCIHTLAATAAYKIIENHDGIAFIQIAQRMAVQS